MFQREIRFVPQVKNNQIDPHGDPSTLWHNKSLIEQPSEEQNLHKNSCSDRLYIFTSMKMSILFTYCSNRELFQGFYAV